MAEPVAKSCPSAPPRRAGAIDALRGFAILTMALSGYIPWAGLLPAWMYHAQVPPPTHKFDPTVPGITWVDLVFPFFLFSMGAAIPLALSRRREKGEPLWKILLYVAERAVLLGAFAIYIQHVYPLVIDPKGGARAHGLGLLGFAICFPVLTRLPGSWNRYLRWGIRAVGLAAAIALMCWLRYPDGSGFSRNRSNIIMVVLTNMAVFGSLIWLAFPKNRALRLAVLLLLLGMRLAHDQPGWTRTVWDYSPIPWVYQFRYLQYLFIIIPGTIVGDAIVAWMRPPPGEGVERGSWSGAAMAALGLLSAAVLVVALVGLAPGVAVAERPAWVRNTLFVVLALSVIGAALVSRPRSSTERLLQYLFAWGAAWLVIGLAFEPFEGGIKKDHATLSYYFVTTGLAIFLLITFTVAIDIFGKGGLRLLVDNGQNPMLAYLGIQCLLRPLLALTGAQLLLERYTSAPWLGSPGQPWMDVLLPVAGFLRGLVMTLLLALAVSALTRLRVFWRA